MASLILGAAAITYQKVQEKKVKKRARIQHNEERYTELQLETEQRTAARTLTKSPTSPHTQHTDDEWWNQPAPSQPTQTSNSRGGNDEWWTQPAPQKQEGKLVDDEWWLPKESAATPNKDPKAADVDREERQDSADGGASPRVQLQETHIPPASPTRRRSTFGENREAPFPGPRQGSVSAGGPTNGQNGDGVVRKGNAGEDAVRNGSVESDKAAKSGRKTRSGSAVSAGGKDAEEGRRQSLSTRVFARINKAGESMGGGAHFAP